MDPQTHSGLFLDNLGINSIKMDQLASELREDGEDAFRERYACAFLLLKFGPPKIDDDIDLFTEKSFMPQFGKNTNMLMGIKAVPLVKSDRNAFGSKIALGRARNNDVVIRAALVSKLHAAFYPDDRGRYRLQDFGSLNGTVVNGKRLAKKDPIRLNNGDTVSFWRYVFEFVTLDEMLSRLNRNSN